MKHVRGHCDDARVPLLFIENNGILCYNSMKKAGGGAVMSDRIDKILDLVEKVYIELQDTKIELQDTKAGIDERFGNIDKRFGNIDERLDNIDKRMDNIEGRLTKVEQGQKRLEALIENDIETDIKALYDGYKQVYEKQQEHDRRFNILESKLEQQNVEIRVIKGGSRKIK